MISGKYEDFRWKKSLSEVCCLDAVLMQKWNSKCLLIVAVCYVVRPGRELLNESFPRDIQ